MAWKPCAHGTGTKIPGGCRVWHGDGTHEEMTEDEHAQWLAYCREKRREQERRVREQPPSR